MLVAVGLLVVGVLLGTVEDGCGVLLGGLVAVGGVVAVLLTVLVGATDGVPLGTVEDGCGVLLGRVEDGCGVPLGGVVTVGVIVAVLLTVLVGATEGVPLGTVEDGCGVPLPGGEAVAQAGVEDGGTVLLGPAVEDDGTVLLGPTVPVSIGSVAIAVIWVATASIPVGTQVVVAEGGTVPLGWVVGLVGTGVQPGMSPAPASKVTMAVWQTAGRLG